jgi:hypothetical protein
MSLVYIDGMIDQHTIGIMTENKQRLLNTTDQQKANYTRQ